MSTHGSASAGGTGPFLRLVLPRRHAIRETSSGRGYAPADRGRAWRDLFDLEVAAQVDDVGQAQAKQRFGVAGGQILEVVRPEQPARMMHRRWSADPRSRGLAGPPARSSTHPAQSRRARLRLNDEGRPGEPCRRRPWSAWWMTIACRRRPHQGARAVAWPRPSLLTTKSSQTSVLSLISAVRRR